MLEFEGRRNRLFGIIDQLLVSGTSFLAMIIVARSSSLEDVGRFVLMQSVIVVLMAFLDAMITRPFTVQIMKPAGTPQQHAGAALMLTSILSALCFAFAAIAAIVLIGIPLPSFSPLLMLMFGVAAAASLMREFARRHCFAEYNSRRALKLDILASGVILALLLWFAWQGEMNANTAILTVSLGGLPAVAAWWYRQAHKFEFSRSGFGAMARQNWALGRWFTISQMAMQFQGYSNYWLAPFMIGTAMTGAFAEAMSIISLTNPFIYGLLNVLTPKSVRTLHHRGQQSLAHETKRDMLLIGVLMAGFVVVVMLFGENLLRLIFGSVQDGAGHLMTLLAVGVGIGGTASPLTIALQSQQRGRELANTSLVSMVLAFILSGVFIWEFGLIGAGWALVLAEVFSMAQRYWLMFFKRVESAP